MNIIPKDAADFRKHLEEKLRNQSSKTGEDILRLRRKVAFDRLLARVFSQEEPLFFLKGGYGMELRTAEARATKDIDLTFLKRVMDANDPMSELILQELQMLARINLNDYMIYRIGPSQIDIENAPYGGSRHNVSVFINNRFFVEFHLDVGGDFLVDEIEKISGINWLEFCGIAPPTISMISIEQQFAEKLHAYTLPRERVNTRSKDLIDLVLLLKTSNRGPQSFQRSLQRVFRARNTHPLPEILPEPPLSWKKPFAEMAAECGISQNMEDGFIRVSEFYKVLQEMNKEILVSVEQRV